MYSEFLITDEDYVLSSLNNIKNTYEGHSICFWILPDGKSYTFPIYRDLISESNYCDQASSTLDSFENLQSIGTNL